MYEMISDEKDMVGKSLFFHRFSVSFVTIRSQKNGFLCGNWNRPQ